MLVVQIAVLVVAVASLASVRRALGSPYVVYSALVMLLPAIARPLQLGVGRHVLVAFPVFAVVAMNLRRDLPRARWLILLASVLAFGFQFSLFARWYFVG